MNIVLVSLSSDEYCHDGLFIFIMSNYFRKYYFEEIFYLRDELEGSTGYLFLTAMVVTSFRFGRKHLSPKQWKLLHKSGLYFLWAYPFSVYWWNLSYYKNPVPIDYVFYWSGFLAFALRIAAWSKKRQQAAFRNGPGNSPLLNFCSRLSGRRILYCGCRTGHSSLIYHSSLLGWAPC